MTWKVARFSDAGAAGTLLHRAAVLGAVVLSSAFLAENTKAALLPPDYLNAVVALGRMTVSPSPDQLSGKAPEPKWSTEGTGFFFGYPVTSDPDPAKRQYEVYLVTARHVVDGHSKITPDDILVRVNSNDPSKA